MPGTLEYSIERNLGAIQHFNSQSNHRFIISGFLETIISETIPIQLRCNRDVNKKYRIKIFVFIFLDLFVDLFVDLCDF